MNKKVLIFVLLERNFSSKVMNNSPKTIIFYLAYFNILEGVINIEKAKVGNSRSKCSTGGYIFQFFSIKGNKS